MKKFITLAIIGAALSASSVFGATINPYYTTGTFSSATELAGQNFTAVEAFNAVSSIFTITPATTSIGTHNVSGGVWNDVVSQATSPVMSTSISLTSGNSMLGVIGLWDLSPGSAGSNLAITINFQGGGSQTLTYILGSGVGGNTGQSTTPFYFGFTSDQAFTSFTISAASNGGVENFTLDNLQAVSPAAVPEPSTFGMVGLAMVGLGLLRRSRR
ncbi:MAG: hypothetical protein RL328_924 [Acidobacteriota bacterium]